MKYLVSSLFCLSLIFIGVFMGNNFINMKLTDPNYLLVALTLILALVGYWQLEKIHIGNAVQLVTHLENEWNLPTSQKSRKDLARGLNQYLVKQEKIDQIGEKDWEGLQNTVEEVIDFFEKLGSLVKNSKFPISVVYDLYSYYVIGFWECLVRIGYFERVTKEHKNAKDFYEKFSWIYRRFIFIGKRKNYFVCYKKWVMDDCKKFCTEESAKNKNF